MSHKRRIDHPKSIDLSDYDPADTGAVDQQQTAAELPDIMQKLARYQELMYGAAHQSLLIVLQGLDTSGKDGTVKHVMSAINPGGCHVWSFKVPTAEEAAHDFLWRIHARTPEKGMVAIFNRSHYEDVLVTRVHKLITKAVCKQRYDQINQFESLLAANGTLVIKFFLHISSDEQRKRLLAREQEPEKGWKLSVNDWHERAYWDEYQKVYADAIGACASENAPWYIVPADHKWYRDYTIARSLVDFLEPHHHAWQQELEERGKAALAEIQAAGVHKKGQ